MARPSAAPERGPLPDGADARPQGVRRRRPHLRGLRDREHDHEQRHVGERVHEERPSRPGRRDHDAADDRTRDRAHGRRARLQRGELGEAVVGHGHPVERRPRRRDEGGDDADGEVGAEEDRVGEVAVDDDRHQHERHHDLPGLADGTDDPRVVARQPPDDRREHEGGERPGREHEDGEHQRTRVLVRDERDRDRGHRRADIADTNEASASRRARRSGAVTRRCGHRGGSGRRLPPHPAFRHHPTGYG